MTATLLFDLDGTLVETDHLHFQAFQRIFSPRGVDVDWETYRTRIIGKANAAIAREFLPHVDVGEHAAIMESKEAAYRDLVGAIEPAPGLLTLLDWADEAGIPYGVVTNAPRLNAELILRGAGLEGRFPVLVIGPELADAKPHPRPYLEGLAALGGDAERSVAFEDSPSGATSAKAAGLAVVGPADLRRGGTPDGGRRRPRRPRLHRSGRAGLHPAAHRGCHRPTVTDGPARPAPRVRRARREGPTPVPCGCPRC